MLSVSAVELLVSFMEGGMVVIVPLLVLVGVQGICVVLARRLALLRNPTRRILASGVLALKSMVALGRGVVGGGKGAH